MHTELPPTALPPLSPMPKVLAPALASNPTPSQLPSAVVNRCFHHKFSIQASAPAWKCQKWVPRPKISLHSPILILSVVAPASRGHGCFLTAFIRLLPHQQESSIYTKKPLPNVVLYSFLVQSKSCSRCFLCMGLSRYVSDWNTMSMGSYGPRFLQCKPMNLLCIVGFVHHPPTFITSPLRRAICYDLCSNKVYHQNLVFFQIYLMER